MAFFKCIIYLIVSIKLVKCSTILGIFPVPSISHQIVYRALTTELARRKHEFTVITPDPIPNSGKPENYTQIDVHNISYNMWRETFDYGVLRSSIVNPVHLYPIFKNALINIFDAQMSTREVKVLMRNHTKDFDLLILENLDMTLGAAWKYKIPYIGINSMIPPISNFEAVGNPTHPILYADFFSTKAGKLDIYGSIISLYNYCFVQYTDNFNKFQNRENSIAKKHFGDDCPPVDIMGNNMDIFFINVHPLIVGIRPTVPSIVYLGGMHMSTKTKLPKDLQQFLDEADEGVIYMSLGSNIMSEDLPLSTLNIIVEVFRELSYKVLWKYDGDILNAPSNLKTYTWLPQDELLGHRNVKAFITQGGQQSMEEAIKNHVPMIGIPFIADQDFNVQNSIRLGIGVGLDINRLTKDELKEAILDVASNTKYKKAMVRLSALLSDQPMSSLERAVWWTEYVLRHGGARHLRAPAAGMSAWEYFMLDVAGFVIAIAFASILFLILIIRLMFKVIKLTHNFGSFVKRTRSLSLSHTMLLSNEKPEKCNSFND